MRNKTRTLLLWLYTSYLHTCIQILAQKYTLTHADSYLGQANQRGIPLGFERETRYARCFSSISAPAFLTLQVLLPALSLSLSHRCFFLVMSLNFSLKFLLSSSCAQIFSLASSSMALGTPTTLCPPFWSRLKYLNKCLLDCYKICHWLL